MADSLANRTTVFMSKKDDKAAYAITDKWLDHNEKNGKEHNVEYVAVKIDGYNGGEGPFYARMEMKTNDGKLLHYFCSDKRAPANTAAEAIKLLSDVVVKGNPGRPEKYSIRS